MKKKITLRPEIAQKFNWGGTTKQWEDQAEKLSNQLQTIEVINEIIEKQDCGKNNKT